MVLFFLLSRGRSVDLRRHVPVGVRPPGGLKGEMAGAVLVPL
jgi:hypothetical protein